MSIPLEKLAEGFDLSRVNAQRLLLAAEVLEKNENFSAAALLGFLSLEESAKAALIWKFKEDRRNITMKQWEKKFTKHIPKLREIISSISTHKIKVDFEDFDINEFDITTNARFQQWLKEKLVYLDYDFKRKDWTDPFVGSKVHSAFAIAFARAGLELVTHFKIKDLRGKE